MSTVASEFKIRKLCRGDVGVEIEVEGRNLPLAALFWRNDVDGSLRGVESREYVLKTPSSMIDLKKALEYLDKLYTESNTVVDDSVRTGVHIHINCQRLTLTQLATFMTVYLVLENVLVSWCGEHRDGNLFCLKTEDAEFSLFRIIEAFKGGCGKFFRMFKDDEIRYSSMNVKALADYGSLEFRAMRGTRDLSVIYFWAGTILNLRNFSMGYEDPKAVISKLSEMGIDRFARLALGDNYRYFLREGFEDRLIDGMHNAQDLAYCRSWNDLDQKSKWIGNMEVPEDTDTDNLNEPLGDF